jgi:hypothetical protein
MSNFIAFDYLNGLRAKVNVLRESQSAKGEELSAEDIVHYGKVLTALGETIRLMAQIDEIVNQHGGWPLK